VSGANPSPMLLLSVFFFFFKITAVGSERIQDWSLGTRYSIESVVPGQASHLPV